MIFSSNDDLLAPENQIGFPAYCARYENFEFIGWYIMCCRYGLTGDTTEVNVRKMTMHILPLHRIDAQWQNELSSIRKTQTILPSCFLINLPSSSGLIGLNVVFFLALNEHRTLFSERISIEVLKYVLQRVDIKAIPHMRAPQHARHICYVSVRTCPTHIKMITHHEYQKRQIRCAL